jgi:hypothetical protein
MVVTWIEVADSAVKIGLGAAIGGIAAFVTTKAQHHHEVKKERLHRRRDLFQAAAAEFQKHSTAVNQLLFVLQFPNHPVTHDDHTREVLNLIQDSRTKLVDAGGLLSLLGEDQILGLYRTYSEGYLQLCAFLFRKRQELPKLDSEIVNEKTEPLNDQGRVIRRQIADAFHRT